MHIEPTAAGQASSVQRERKLDENGDEIIVEGVCQRSDVLCGVYGLYNTALAGIILLLIALCCAVKAAYSWKLHLTSAGIWYTDVIKTCFCLYKQHFIPLSDINDIQIEGKSILLKFNASVVNKKVAYPSKLDYVHNAEEFAAAIRQQMAANHM